MKAQRILKDFQLKHTSCREEVLKLMLKHDHALAHADIEKGINPATDRVTVYRTLKTFLGKGLIHKVLDNEGATKYALCQECTTEEHHHEHVHFKCIKCGHTSCLDDIDIPPIELPEGYQSQERNLLISGICKSCDG